MQTYTVFAHWKTERQAKVTLEAESAEIALAEAKLLEDQWVGDNHELDNSDGPTEYEVHEGEGYSEPVLSDPSEDRRLQDAAPKLLAALKRAEVVCEDAVSDAKAAGMEQDESAAREAWNMVRAAIAEAEAAGVAEPEAGRVPSYGALLGLVTMAVEAWPQYETDEEIDGGDMVDWFAGWRRMATDLIGPQEPFESDDLPAGAGADLTVVVLLLIATRLVSVVGDLLQQLTERDENILPSLQLDSLHTAIDQAEALVFAAKAQGEESRKRIEPLLRLVTNEIAPPLTLRRFHNALRILTGIDRHELVERGIIDSGDDTAWKEFTAAPHYWMVTCGDDQCAKLWALIEARQPQAEG